MTSGQITTKLAILRENLDKLAQIPQGSYAEFIGDFRNLDSALHRLQTSIQALIDIASYLTARRALGAPKSSVDTLEKLEAAGLLPEGAVQRYSAIIGFRNRIVHLYDRVDPQIVYRILVQERNDLEALAQHLVDALDDAEMT